MIKLTTTFNEVKNIKSKNLRGLVRDLALNVLSIRTKFPNANTIYEMPRVQFLYIHHVFDDEINNFDKLLELLSKHHSFISYSDAVNKILTGNIDKPYICISSDDGFKNNLAAAKIMDKYGAKGCFFVNPDTIGLKDISKVKSFCDKRLNFPPTEFMDWNDVDKLIKSGHEIGSHTMGHINIAETNINLVEDNINESFEILNERIGKVLHFAYPYGRFFHFNKQAFDLVFKIGFVSCATAERGCHVAADRKLNTNELLIRRDHVICDWNINHVLFFILNNSEKASFQTNLYPDHD